MSAQVLKKVDIILLIIQSELIRQEFWHIWSCEIYAVII